MSIFAHHTGKAWCWCETMHIDVKLSNDPLGALSFENLQKCLLKSKQTHQLDTLLEQAESIAWNEHKIQSFIQKLHVCLSHSTNEDETDNYSDFDCYNAQMWGAVFQTWIVKTSNLISSRAKYQPEVLSDRTKYRMSTHTKDRKSLMECPFLYCDRSKHFYERVSFYLFSG